MSYVKIYLTNTILNLGMQPLFCVPPCIFTFSTSLLLLNDQLLSKKKSTVKVTKNRAQFFTDSDSLVPSCHVDAALKKTASRSSGIALCYNHWFWHCFGNTEKSIYYMFSSETRPTHNSSEWTRKILCIYCGFSDPEKLELLDQYGCLIQQKNI